MKKNRKLLSFFLLMFCTFSLKSETLKAVIFAKANPPYTIFEAANPPYTIIEAAKSSGIIVDIFKKLEQMTEHNFILLTMPAARAMHEFDAGRIDIEAGVNENWRRHNKVFGQFSIPYAHSAEVVVFNKKPFKVSSVKDLYGKKVGIVRGYSYPDYDQAFKEGKIIKIENVSESNLLRQLLMGRLEQIFIGYRTILYYQQQFPEYQQLIIGDIVNEDEVKIRLHPNKSHLLPEINLALRKMIAAGDIDKIYQKYQ